MSRRFRRNPASTRRRRHAIGNFHFALDRQAFERAAAQKHAFASIHHKERHALERWYAGFDLRQRACGHVGRRQRAFRRALKTHD